MHKKIFLILSILVFVFSFIPNKTTAQESNDSICAVYFSKIGCPYCEKVNPVILSELFEKYPNLVIIKYEISPEKKQNAVLINEYNNEYGSGLSVPLVIFSKNSYLAADKDILSNINNIIEQYNKNPCPLINGNAISFNKLDLDSLPGEPEIFTSEGIIEQTDNQNNIIQSKLTFTKILLLGLADSINPCVLAVLFLILITILAYNPGNRKKVLLVGLAFVFSVFIMYFIYGLIIVKFFQLIQAIDSIKAWIYKSLGALAIILGILNIKDFIKYRPGGVCTEMPMFLRPKVKNIISKATSLTGAFVIGAFVTLFLLPCTIGPYVIVGGILSILSMLKTLPWLLFYNLVFVLPMLIIIAIVYFSTAKLENISEWKDKNIRYLHLIAGVIILLLGILMVFSII